MAIKVHVTELTMMPASRWQALKDHHASEMQRFLDICNGLDADQIVPAAVAISVHEVHKRTLAKMIELEAQR